MHGKETYYFSHDNNARNDEKILMLRAEHGWQGYGLFWALVEMMFEAQETCLYHSKVKGIAISYNVDITLLEAVIDTCIEERLFISDGEVFWSETLRQRKKKFLESRQQRSEAGKKGMAKRWGSDNGVITKNNKVKESKVKESTTTEEPQISTTDIFKFHEQNIGLISPLVAEKIEHWIKDTEEPLVLYAFEKAVFNNVRTYSYAEGILKNWIAQGIKTRKDAETADLEFKRKKASAKDPPSTSPPHYKEDFSISEEDQRVNHQKIKELTKSIGKGMG